MMRRPRARPHDAEDRIFISILNGHRRLRVSRRCDSRRRGETREVYDARLPRRQDDAEYEVHLAKQAGFTTYAEYVAARKAGPRLPPPPKALEPAARATGRS